jgi:hypothetical protein
MVNEFWVSDPSIIYKDYWQIIPTNNMSRVKQLNAVSRLIIYYIILLIIFGSRKNIINYLLIILVIIIIFYYAYSNNEDAIISDITRENQEENKEFYKQQNNDNVLNSADYNPSINSIYNKFNNSILKDGDKDEDFILNSGYIDFDNEYNLGKDRSIINIDNFNKQQKKERKNKLPYTKNKIYKENTCRRPTAENPFMNVVFSDYLDLENVPQACNTSDENIQKEMNNLYNSSIFRNTSDVFARNNSQNMFYTVPTNLGVQGQTDYRNWLFKTNQTCKENTANCTYPDRLYGESQRY